MGVWGGGYDWIVGVFCVVWLWCMFVGFDF